jgi:hypothetical protein
VATPRKQSMGRWKKSWFKKWFSLGQHKRCAGAKKFSDQISTDFTKQKKYNYWWGVIQYTHVNPNNLDAHFELLRDKFVYQSELC